MIDQRVDQFFIFYFFRLFRLQFSSSMVVFRTIFILFYWVVFSLSTACINSERSVIYRAKRKVPDFRIRSLSCVGGGKKKQLPRTPTTNGGVVMLHCSLYITFYIYVYAFNQKYAHFSSVGLSLPRKLSDVLLCDAPFFSRSLSCFLSFFLASYSPFFFSLCTNLSSPVSASFPFWLILRAFVKWSPRKFERVGLRHWTLGALTFDTASSGGYYAIVMSMNAFFVSLSLPFSLRLFL